jgi:hypothetical protein
MRWVPHFLPAVAVFTMIAAAPAFAQDTPAIRHMLIQYRPVSDQYCFDVATTGASAHLPDMRCKAHSGWAHDRVAIARR